MKIKARVVGQTVIDPNRYVVLNHLRLSNEDYSRRDLGKFTAIGSRFEHCRFENTRINDASFGSGIEMSEYIDCCFNGLRFNHGGGLARFVRCSFKDVLLHEWMGQGTELIDCVFSGKIRASGFFAKIPIPEYRTYLKRDRNEFHGNDFSAISLLDADFRGGIDLTRQCLPSGPQYIYLPNATAAVARAQSDLEKWNTNPEVRRAALIMADTFKKLVAEGQEQFFLWPDSYYKYSEKTFPREAIDKVFALLRGELK